MFGVAACSLVGEGGCLGTDTKLIELIQIRDPRGIAGAIGSLN